MAEIIASDRRVEGKRIARESKPRRSRLFLVQAIAAAGELGPLLHELQVAGAKRDELKDLIGALRRADVRRLDCSEIERRAHEHVRRDVRRNGRCCTFSGSGTGNRTPI